MRSSVAGREISARGAARPAPSSEPARYREEETPILSDQSSQSVQLSFGRLAGSVAARSVDAQALEDMTRDILRGMLKQWLDDNLPSMVERLVREEIERVARTGR
jgi:cell pole-organizing protein PopZ